jgi:bifunctional non-homologous end joining protein LigD
MRDAESLAKPTVLLSPPVALEYDRYVAFPRIVPIAPVRVREPFDHRDWIFEPKLDGFRALAYVADGSCTLLSRRGHAYKAFAPLATAMAAALGNQQAVLDGEIVCLNKTGEPQFNALLFGRARAAGQAGAQPDS